MNGDNQVTRSQFNPMEIRDEPQSKESGKTRNQY